MTIRRVDETVRLEGVCPVEDAETLMQEIQAGATVIDWTECDHLHTACLQVMIVSAMPVRGLPQNPLLARWVPGMLPAAMRLDSVGTRDGGGGGPGGGTATRGAKPPAPRDRETACLTEV